MENIENTTGTKPCAVSTVIAHFFGEIIQERHKHLDQVGVFEILFWAQIKDQRQRSLRRALWIPPSIGLFK